MLINDAVNIINGKIPARKILIVTHISECKETAAKAPIRGAIDHIKNDTRFGFVFPLSVSLIYTTEPATEITALTITKK